MIIPTPPQTQGERAAAIIADWLEWLPARLPARLRPSPEAVSNLTRQTLTLLVTGYPEDAIKASLAAVWIDQGHRLIAPFAVDLGMVAWRWRTGQRYADRAWRERITAEAERITAEARTVTEGVSA